MGGNSRYQLRRRCPKTRMKLGQLVQPWHQPRKSSSSKVKKRQFFLIAERRRTRMRVACQLFRKDLQRRVRFGIHFFVALAPERHKLIHFYHLTFDSLAVREYRNEQCTIASAESQLRVRKIKRNQRVLNLF